MATRVRVRNTILSFFYKNPSRHQTSCLRTHPPLNTSKTLLIANIHSRIAPQPLRFTKNRAWAHKLQPLRYPMTSKKFLKPHNHIQQNLIHLLENEIRSTTFSMHYINNFITKHKNLKNHPLDQKSSPMLEQH